MVLNRYRKQADRVLIPLSKPFVNCNPDVLTWVAFFSAVIAGIFFFLSSENPYYLLFASVFVLSNAFFDAMDGRIAKLRGMASKRGDFLDHVLDRYADALMLGGITFSIYCREWIGIMAMLGVIFASYMGTQAHAVGAGRDYGGILGRADRLVFLMIFPAIQFLSPGRLVIYGFSASALEVMMIWFAIAGHITAFQRAHRAWKWLKQRSSE